MAPWPRPRALEFRMKMELIQPFINAADAVLSQGLQSPMLIGNLSMEQESYRRKGVAALIWLTGDIEGRIIFDLDTQTAARVASQFAGAEVPESDSLVRETVCELANQVIGNAVTTLNDQGFHFRVHPPVLHLSEHGSESSEDTEAMVLSFETQSGLVYMNIALRYRMPEKIAAASA
jgi:chemotaxis protein CheX